MTRLVASAIAFVLIAATPLGANAQGPNVLVDPRSVYDWSGFYIGHQFGWGWADQHIEDNTGLDADIGLNGGFFGPMAGFQRQWDRFVLGAEVEVNWSDVDGQETVPGATGRAFGNVDVFGSAAAKVGVAWDRVLLYATAGIAGAEMGTRQRNGPASSEDHAAAFGWMAGAGIDFAVTRHLILGLQYRHYDLGEADFIMGFVPDRTGDLRMDTVSAHLSVKIGGR